MVDQLKNNAQYVPCVQGIFLTLPLGGTTIFQTEMVPSQFPLARNSAPLAPGKNWSVVTPSMPAQGFTAASESARLRRTVISFRAINVMVLVSCWRCCGSLSILLRLPRMETRMDSSSLVVDLTLVSLNPIPVPLSEGSETQCQDRWMDRWLR